MRFWIQTISLVFILGCASKSQNKNDVDKTQSQQVRKFLALGDSYTIGESVDQEMRWPVQLSKQLNEAGIAVDLPRIIATTGWTTDELEKAINEANITETYDIVSLLIGVNNQYRGYPFTNYEKELAELLESAIQFANNKVNRVFVVSIPDYGVTPFGQQKEPVKIAVELDRYNALAKEICQEKDVTFINITHISRKAQNDTSLVAPDGLHPSGKMYTDWVELIFPEVKRLLE